jgi:hypothetical protein
MRRSRKVQRKFNIRTRTEPEKPKGNRIWLRIAAVFAGIVTPGAYLIGLSYYQGYMEAFGMDPDCFPLSVQDIYVRSYYAVGYFLIALKDLCEKGYAHIANNFILSIVLFFTLILSVYCCFKLRHIAHIFIQCARKKRRNILSFFHWKNNDLLKSISIPSVILYCVLLLTTLFMLSPFLWLIFPLSAYHQGENFAQKKINLFLKKGCHEDPKKKWNTCFSILNEKGAIIDEGLIIAINDTKMAIFKKDGSYVLPIKDNTLLKRTLH